MYAASSDSFHYQKPRRRIPPSETLHVHQADSFRCDGMLIQCTVWNDSVAMSVRRLDDLLSARTDRLAGGEPALSM